MAIYLDLNLKNWNSFCFTIKLLVKLHLALILLSYLNTLYILKMGCEQSDIAAFDEMVNNVNQGGQGHSQNRQPQVSSYGSTPQNYA